MAIKTFAYNRIPDLIRAFRLLHGNGVNEWNGPYNGWRFYFNDCLPEIFLKGYENEQKAEMLHYDKFYYDAGSERFVHEGKYAKASAVRFFANAVIEKVEGVIKKADEIRAAKACKPGAI